MKSDAEKCLDKINTELSEGRINEDEAQKFREQVEAKVEQKQKLLDDFKAQKIDEVTFNQWQISISDDLRQLAEEIDLAEVTRKKKKRKIKKAKTLAIVVAVLLLTIAGGAAIYIPQYMHAHRAIAGIPEPIQNNLSDAAVASRVGETRKTISGSGFKVDMIYLAEYDIKGLVVQLDDYDNKYDATAFDKAIPRDISMAWGKSAEYADKIEWSHVARSLNAKFSNELVNKAGVDALSDSSSNNHVIVEEGELRNKLKRVRIGDYIEMKGYLVSATIFDGSGATVRQIESSMVRTDHVEYAFDMRTSCEVLYLTELEWLE